MLHEWIDPLLIRYGVFISILGTVITIATGLRMLKLCSDTTKPASPIINACYIIGMFFCVLAVLTCGDAIIERVVPQSHRIQRFLNRKFDLTNVDNTVYMNHLQATYRCCGVNSASDYNHHEVPESCCDALIFAQDAQKQNLDVCTAYMAYPRGCTAALVANMTTAAKYLSSIAFAFGCLGIVGAIISCTCGQNLGSIVGGKKNDEI